ncbi:hypothetical protein SHKM778_28910 [Streptomyces sp. KM77-8]|uniref:Secreted protein n=1 Tax=Streptomyces haneummycinicus TaxID=3074435 RepID=A0AAT9HGG2_9ACTN
MWFAVAFGAAVAFAPSAEPPPPLLRVPCAACSAAGASAARSAVDPPESSAEPLHPLTATAAASRTPARAWARRIRMWESPVW